MRKENLLFALLSTAFGSFLQAQSPCDLLTIRDIRFDAFRDTVLLVEVTNDSPSIFDYPGFILYDSNGDTIAKEVVNFFGIGTSHISAMNIYPNALLPSDTFQGALELWTGFYSEMACSFDISELLCPDTICNTLVFDFSNLGGALTNGAFTYTITDVLGTVQVSKDFSLGDTVQQFQDTLCLPNGDYALSISTNDNPVAGQPYFLLYEPKSQYWASNLVGPFDQGTTTTTQAFTLYGECPSTVNATKEVTPENPVTISWTPEGVRAFTSKGKIEELILYDLAGRRIASLAGSGPELFLPAGNRRGLFIAACILDSGLVAGGKGYW